MKIRAASFDLPLPGALLASLIAHAGAMMAAHDSSSAQALIRLPLVATAPATAVSQRPAVIKLRLLAASVTTPVRESAPVGSRTASPEHSAVPARKAAQSVVPISPSASAQVLTSPDSASDGTTPRETGDVLATAPPHVQPASPATQPAAALVAPLNAPRFDASYLDNPAPAYPPLSRRVGEQGRVLLRVQVDAAGSPSHVEIGSSSGSSRLDQAALEAVRRWRFVPATRGEKAVSAEVLVPIQFNLRS